MQAPLVLLRLPLLWCEAHGACADLDCVAFDIASLADVRVVGTIPLDVSDFAAAFAGLVVHWAASTMTCCMSRVEAFVAHLPLHQPGAVVRVVLSPAPPARCPDWLLLRSLSISPRTMAATDCMEAKPEGDPLKFPLIIFNMCCTCWICCCCHFYIVDS